MDAATVISAERFAREQTSYWSQLLPRMEAFVRAVNLGPARFSPPIATSVDPERRAFVAELAFELLSMETSGDLRPLRIRFNEASERVRRRVARLSSHEVIEIPPPTSVETREAAQLLSNLRAFIRERRPEMIEMSPDIPGCGVIDRAAADIFIKRQRLWSSSMREGPETLLYEVKVVDRSFRAIDFRQLITYAALMSAADVWPDIVGLVNPRLGTFFECSLDELAMDAAGLPADALLQQIVFEVSSSETSP